MSNGLNQQQIKHARERINAIANLKIEQIREKFVYNQPHNLKTSLTRDEKYKQIQSGTAKIMPQDKLGSYTDWHEAFVFDTKSIDSAVKAIELAKAKVQANIDAAVAKVNQKRNVMIDELMLGDAKGVLAQLKAFEALDFTKSSK